MRIAISLVFLAATAAMILAVLAPWREPFHWKSEAVLRDAARASLIAESQVAALVDEHSQAAPLLKAVHAAEIGIALFFCGVVFVIQNRLFGSLTVSELLGSKTWLLALLFLLTACWTVMHLLMKDFAPGFHDAQRLYLPIVLQSAMMSFLGIFLGAFVAGRIASANGARAYTISLFCLSFILFWQWCVGAYATWVFVRMIPDWPSLLARLLSWGRPDPYPPEFYLGTGWVVGACLYLVLIVVPLEGVIWVLKKGEIDYTAKRSVLLLGLLIPTLPILHAVYIFFGGAFFSLAAALCHNLLHVPYPTVWPALIVAFAATLLVGAQWVQAREF